MDKEQQPDASSREDVHAAKAKQMEETQKLHPETDMKLGSNWWQPGTDLSFDVKGQLDDATNQKFNAILQKILSGSLEPDEVGKALEEAEGCLAGHPDLVERFNTIFKAVNVEMLAAMVNMKSQSAESCAPASEQK
ncbi:hypothetical protein K4F52_001820 [Lecanicillium sp. MT-2017a]|nr:hypothetical protein K4F52_001820 [Lecanicillium sp. MT-2017a]